MSLYGIYTVGTTFFVKVKTTLAQTNPENEYKRLAVNIYLFIPLSISFSLREIKCDLRMFFFMQRV